MSDKKIIIVALVLSAVVIGAGWYYSQNGISPASILNPQASETPKAENNKTVGISYGNPDAPVVIEEYFSFLCGACVNFKEQTFGLIENDYIKTGKVRFVFYAYPPLEFGAAVYCAQKQDKYTEYADYLFNHNAEIQEAQDLLDFSANAGLNQSGFIACYNSDDAKNAAQAWYDRGVEKEVDATPTFFINGQKLVGAQPYAEFQKIIDEKLNQIK